MRTNATTVSLNGFIGAKKLAADYTVNNVQDINQLQTLLQRGLSTNDEPLLEAVAAHHLITSKMLHQIAVKDGLDKAKKVVASRAKVSLETQQILVNAYFTDSNIANPCAVLANNIHTDPQILVNLAESDNIYVIELLVENLCSPEKVINRIFERIVVEQSLLQNTGIFISTILNPLLKKEYLVQTFYNPPSFFITEEEINTPDTFSVLNHALVSNPALPPHVLTKIVDKAPIAEANESQWVNFWGAVAEYGNCDDNVFEKLINLENDNVRRGLCENPSTPTWVLKAILETQNKVRTYDHYMLEKLIAHRNTTFNILAGMASDVKHYGLMKVIKNEMFNRGMLEDWPVEWLEEHHGMKFNKGGQ